MRALMTGTLLAVAAVGLAYAVRTDRSPGLRMIWPIVLVIAFNLIWADQLPPRYGDDVGVPVPLLVAENALRVVVFGWPVFLREDGPRRTLGWGLIALGLVIYMASWVPLLVDRAMADHWLAFGPAVTPALFLYAVAWLARSWPYAGAVTAFLALHVAHQFF